MPAGSYRLYYWPNFGGRAEGIRLMLEDAGQRYEEVNDPVVIKDLMISSNPDKSGDGWPCFAIPILEKPGGIRVSQTPAICRFLASHLGYTPQPFNYTSEAKVDAANLTVYDYITEFGKLHNNTKKDPDNAGKILDEYKSRYEAFMTYFERCLKSNGGGSGLYLVGQRPTYADFSLLSALRATEEVIGDSISMSSFELIKGFKKRMEQRPKLVAYFKSNRSKPILPPE